MLAFAYSRARRLPMSPAPGAVAVLQYPLLNHPRPQALSLRQNPLPHPKFITTLSLQFLLQATREAPVLAR